MLKNKLLSALAGLALTPIQSVLSDEVFSSYCYTGTSNIKTIVNGVQLGDTFGTTDQITYSVPGIYTFMVPDGVYSISVALAGGGGGSGGCNFNNGYFGGAGGGAGSAYKNNIAVTPGTKITVVVGSGGIQGSSGSGVNSPGSNGTASSILGITANGGVGGKAPNTGGGGTGGTATGTDATVYTGTAGGYNPTSSANGGTIGLPASATLTTNTGKGGSTAYSNNNTPGNNGCVRIIWPGDTRQFPATSCSDLTPVNRVINEGMVWTKCRSRATLGWAVVDSYRSSTLNRLDTTSGAAEVVNTDTVTSFNQDGFTLGVDANATMVNYLNYQYASFSFKKASKFFDMVKFTGDGASYKTIPHSLGITPGMVIIKSINNFENWTVHHRYDGSEAKAYVLNSSAAAALSLGSMGFTSSDFYVFKQGSLNSNTSGNTYIAYLFAHDPSPEGKIKCGSFTTDGNGAATVELGWEPEFLLVKASSNISNWIILDQERGWTNTPYDDSALYLDITNVETKNTNYGKPTSAGFDIQSLTAYTAYIYMAIRKSLKTPSTGKEVYNSISRVGTYGVFAIENVGFAPDMVIAKSRTLETTNPYAIIVDKTRGITKKLTLATVSTEGSMTNAVVSFDPDGITLGTDGNGVINKSGNSYLYNFFKRAKEVFDIVNYNPVSITYPYVVKHNLGITPELIIFKNKTSTSNWEVRYGPGLSRAIHFNLNSISSNGTSIAASSNDISINAANNNLIASGNKFIAYLFASKAGISKVGVYTGNGTSQVINCGFTTGARFILIKAVTKLGNWLTWDTTRGIVAGNDPHDALNLSNSEVTTDDSIDPDTSGFIVNQVTATDINANGIDYLFLAIA